MRAVLITLIGFGVILWSMVHGHDVLAAEYGTAWLYREPVTIGSYLTSATPTDFPIFLFR